MQKLETQKLVIWGLCLKRGLEAEGNSSCVFPKFLALGLVLDLDSMTSSSQHTAGAFSSWMLSWWLVWFEVVVVHDISMLFPNLESWKRQQNRARIYPFLFFPP